MINFNGNLIEEDNFTLKVQNRGFKYGDAIFDTLKFNGEHLFFLEDHYFRLMSSMRMLRMKIPLMFTLEYYEEQILRAIKASNLQEGARVRVSVFRKDGGYYTPVTNEVDFLIEVNPLSKVVDKHYEIELFKDFPTGSGLLATIKTNNRMVNVLASIYAKENNYQNCILINEKKELVEAMNANVFLIKGNDILTPALDSGCINGIIRKKLISGLQNHNSFNISEIQISPFDLLKADEVFLTNSITDIQSVNQYRKKHYSKEKTIQIQEIFEKEIVGY